MNWGCVIGGCIGGILGMAFVRAPSLLTVYPSLPGQGLAVLLNLATASILASSKVYAFFVVGGNAIFYAWVGFGIDRIRARERRKAVHCESCDYNLTGNESGVCPECGTAIDSP